MRKHYLIILLSLFFQFGKTWAQSTGTVPLTATFKSEQKMMLNNLTNAENALNSLKFTKETQHTALNNKNFLLNLIKIRTNRTLEVLNLLNQTNISTIEDTTEAIRYNYLKSLCFSTMGFNDSAWIYCQKNDNIFKSDLKKNLFFEHCLVATGILLKKGQLHKANQYYEKAAQNNILLPEPNKKASLEALLADLFYQQRLYQKAKQHLNVAKEIFEKTENNTGIADCYLTLGNNYYLEIKDDSAFFNLLTFK
ncbi:MAG TPA: tetratricopeptide repeat protein [Edaphocola sp.]|nr:tetratricopeptide repeat protein [Edaphocola sp.]